MTENKKIAIQILNVFAENGFPTYDVDEENRQIYFDWSE